MLEASVPNVSFIFSVAYVSHILQVFYVACVCNGFQLFLQVFHTHILSVSSVFRRMLQMFVSECFKSRSGFASPFSPSAASPWCLLSPSAALHFSQPAEGVRRGRWRGRRHERTLSPSVTRADSASVPLVFLLRRMLRWDGPIGGPRRQPMVRLAGATASGEHNVTRQF